MTTTLLSEQSTESPKEHEVVSSRFQTIEYCLPKTELLKIEAMPSPEVISSRFETVEYFLPQTEILKT